MNLEAPVMLYDGDCQLCRRWINRWACLTGDAVSYQAYQESLAQFPLLSIKASQQSVQLIEPDGAVYNAAEAVLRTLIYTKHYGWLYRLYQKSRLFAAVSEACYRWVARNREVIARIGL